MRNIIVFGGLGYSFGSLLSLAIMRSDPTLMPAMLLIVAVMCILTGEAVSK